MLTSATNKRTPDLKCHDKHSLTKLASTERNSMIKRPRRATYDRRIYQTRTYRTPVKERDRVIRPDQRRWTTTFGQQTGNNDWFQH